MNEDRDRAAFVGRVTAAATHEIRNVLAIVKESAGLVDDLVAAAGPGGAPDPERVRTALGRVETQVARGAELMTSLNRLAHGLDREREAVELGDALRHVVRLEERPLRERGYAVEVREGHAGPDPPAVTANALEVYMALARGIEWCAEHVPGGVAVAPEGGADGPVGVRFLPAVGCPGEGDAAWERLAGDLEGLPAGLERDGPQAGFRLVFV